MSDAEEDGFLSRWSRRKREAREQDRQPEPPAGGPPAGGPPAPAVAPEAADAEPPLDLAELPSIDSLTADSDFTAFLRKGVPTEMKNAALRKLWLSDPAIREYKTLADYDWDFNAPGYGALLPTDDVKKLVDMVLKPRETAPKPDAEAAADVVAGEGAGEGADEAPRVAEAPPPNPVRLSDPARPVATPVLAEVESAAPMHPRDIASAGETNAAPALDDSAQHGRKRRHGGAMPT